jgi:hypothetical protein
MVFSVKILTVSRGEPHMVAGPDAPIVVLDTLLQSDEQELQERYLLPRAAFFKLAMLQLGRV